MKLCRGLRQAFLCVFPLVHDHHTDKSRRRGSGKATTRHHHCMHRPDNTCKALCLVYCMSKLKFMSQCIRQQYIYKYIYCPSIAMSGNKQQYAVTKGWPRYYCFCCWVSLHGLQIISYFLLSACCWLSTSLLVLVVLVSQTPCKLVMTPHKSGDLSYCCALTITCNEICLHGQGMRCAACFGCCYWHVVIQQLLEFTDGTIGSYRKKYGNESCVRALQWRSPF